MTAHHLTKKQIAKAQMLREKEGLTYKALGERFGLSGSAIQLILKKRGKPNEQGSLHAGGVSGM